MIRFSKIKWSIAILTMPFTSVVYATTARIEGIIFYEPTSINPVPTISEGMMITMGILLMVMAIRFLRDDRGAVKTVAVTTLSGGLLVGGYGVEQSLATSEHDITGDECTLGGSHDFDGFFGRHNNLTNLCGNPMIITDIQECVNASDDEPPNTPCQVGTVLAPGGGVCSTPSCEDDF